MASFYYFTILASLFLLSTLPVPSSATARKLATLVNEQPLILKYHNGPLLKGNLTLNLLWYGHFSPSQRSIIVDFLQSFNPPNAPPPPSAASWWQTTQKYIGGSSTLVLGTQILDENYSLGKSLTTSQIISLASKAPHVNSINAVLTAADVAVDGFCMSRCGTHGSGFSNPKDKQSKFAYAWVGNPVSQCPGQCAWPFHQPIYGPQTPPLVAPNGDVGVDGMVINLATVLAGTVTNPFDDGYFQGPATAPLEAVTACTGIFGSGAYPGYAGSVLVDKATGASYNANGVNGRRFLLPAMWDPQTSTCKTFKENNNNQRPTQEQAENQPERNNNEQINAENTNEEINEEKALKAMTFTVLPSLPKIPLTGPSIPNPTSPIRLKQLLNWQL